MVKTANQAEVVFYNRAAGILGSGNLLLLQRKLTDLFWALPGGKIEAGETAEHAFLREMDEELGWLPSNAQLICVFENMFEQAGKTFQENGFYFNADAEDLWQRQGRPASGQEFCGRDKTLVFCWHQLSQLEEIDIRPALLVPILYKK